MEWMSSTLLQEPTILILSISVVVSVFIFAARKAHLNYSKKMKKINESFKLK